MSDDQARDFDQALDFELRQSNLEDDRHFEKAQKKLKGSSKSNGNNMRLCEEEGENVISKKATSANPNLHHRLRQGTAQRAATSLQKTPGTLDGSFL